MVFRPLTTRVLSPIALTIALAGTAVAFADNPPAGTAPSTNSSSSQSSSADQASPELDLSIRGMLEALKNDPAALSADRTKAAREAHDAVVKNLRTFADKNPGSVKDITEKRAEELLGQLPDSAAMMQSVFKDLPQDQAQRLHALMEQARKDSANRKSSTKTTTSKDGKTTTTTNSDSGSSSSKQSNSSSDSSSSNKSDSSSSSSSDKSSSSDSSRSEKKDKGEKSDKSEKSVKNQKHDKQKSNDSGSSSNNSGKQDGGKKSTSSGSGSSSKNDKKTSKQKLTERLAAALNELDLKEREQFENKLGIKP